MMFAYQHTVEDVNLYIGDLRQRVEAELGQPVSRSGKWWTFRCPFHNETHGASLMVCADGWKCLGKCSHDRMHSPIDWYMERNGWSFSQTLDYFTGAAGIISRTKDSRQDITCNVLDNSDMSELSARPLVKFTSDRRGVIIPINPNNQNQSVEPPSTEWQAAARAAVEQAEAYLWSGRPDAQRALDYLRRDRGLTDDTIRRYHLGFNPGWLKTTWVKEDGKLASMAPGIVMPWFVEDALWYVKVRCIVGGLAKALDRQPETLHGEESPKYTSLADGQPAALYNADAVTDGLPVMLVEGEFDAMLAQQLIGDRLAVVTLGSASSDPAQRWRDLLRAVPFVLGSLDTDEAGRKAAKRLADALGSHYHDCNLPTGKDVTEYVTSGHDLGAWIDGELTRIRAARETARADRTATFCTHIFGSLGDMVDKLCTDPKSALADLPRPSTSERSERRNKAAKKCTHYRKDVGAKSGRLAPADEKRANRLRVLFPQFNPVEALIPELSAELLADELTADECQRVLALPAIADLTSKQKFAVRVRMRTLKTVERLEKKLKDVPFILDGPIANVPQLRREVLRQICDALAEVDPVTGEKVARLSNAVQACLLGVTVSALRNIREMAGIEQTAQPAHEKPITSAASLPSGTHSIRIRGENGELRQYYHDVFSTATNAAIRNHRAKGEQVFAVVQPVAAQRIGPRPEPRPRVTVEKMPKILAKSTGTPVKTGSALPKPRKPRQSWREVYADQLMRNLLYHLKVPTSAHDTLHDLGDKLRILINPEANTELMDKNARAREERATASAFDAQRAAKSAPKNPQNDDFVAHFRAIERDLPARRAFLATLSDDQRFELRKAVYA